jgi:hypothetical protein
MNIMQSILQGESCSENKIGSDVELVAVLCGVTGKPNLSMALLKPVVIMYRYG